MSIPTLILFKDGEPKKRMIGAKGKGQLLEELNEFLQVGDRPRAPPPSRRGHAAKCERSGLRPRRRARRCASPTPVGTGGLRPLGRRGRVVRGAHRFRVRHFQESRGLRVDDTCGAQTWGAFVEAGYQLGDRLLYERRPMLRGADVADLQTRLGDLGFFADRVDGILGLQTAAAITDFQRNPRPDRRRHLRSSTPSPPCTGSAGAPRRRSRLGWSNASSCAAGPAWPPPHPVGQLGGLDALATTVTRALQDQGAVVAAWTTPTCRPRLPRRTASRPTSTSGWTSSTGRAAAARTTAAPTTSRREVAGWPNDWPRCSPMPSTARPGPPIRCSCRSCGRPDGRRVVRDRPRRGGRGDAGHRQAVVLRSTGLRHRSRVDPHLRLTTAFFHTLWSIARLLDQAPACSSPGRSARGPRGSRSITIGPRAHPSPP